MVHERPPLRSRTVDDDLTLSAHLLRVFPLLPSGRPAEPHSLWCGEGTAELATVHLQPRYIRRPRSGTPLWKPHPKIPALEVGRDDIADVHVTVVHTSAALHAFAVRDSGDLALELWRRVGYHWRATICPRLRRPIACAQVNEFRLEAASIANNRYILAPSDEQDRLTRATSPITRLTTTKPPEALPPGWQPRRPPPTCGSRVVGRRDPG
jgi:hypothetical protein